MPLRIIAAIWLFSCLVHVRQGRLQKEEAKETDLALLPSEDIKLPELPQKTPGGQETKKLKASGLSKRQGGKYVILNFDGLI